MQLNHLLKSKEGFCFLIGSFLITKSLNIDISSKKRLSSTVDLFSVVRVILFNIYKIYKPFFSFNFRAEVGSLKF